MLGRTARVLRAGLVVAAALAMFPAAASAAQCDKVPTAKVFAPLGDTNDYFLAPGGDFEGALTWERSGPVIQRWIHPALPGAGSTGLVIAAGGSVTSPKLCADLLRPTLRFLAYAYQGQGALRVDAVHDNGQAVVLGRLSGSAFGAGAATDSVAFGTLLGIALDDSKHVRLRLTAESGTWVADAVYVDPYMR
jgi:hypothetical protein